MPQQTTWDQLLAFCRPVLCQENATLSSVPILEKIDWEELLRLARRHRVRPLLYRALLAWNGDVPQSVLVELKAISQKTAFDNLGYTRELLRIIPLFRELGVEIVAYKGSLLAEQAYGEIGIRETYDIDFLFQIEDFSKIKQVLLQQGYQAEKQIPAHFEAHFFKQDCEYNFDFHKNGRRLFHIEPHWTIGHRRRQIDIDYTQLQDWINTKKWFGTSIQYFTPEGLLLTTCLHHGGKDSWLLLKHLCDIAAIVQQFGQQLDWEKLLQKAQALKVENILLLGLSLTAKFFPIQLPDSVQARFSPKIAKLTKIASEKIPQDVALGTLELKSFLAHFWFHIRLRAHWTTRVKVVFYHLLQIIAPNVNDARALPHIRSYWLLLVLKPFRLLRK